MPSLLAPISSTRNGASKSYTPLPDELNPPFKNTAPAPTVTRNGTVTYGKRVASSSSSTSTNSDERGRNQDKLGAHLRSESEETLSPHKGKERAMNGYAHEEADLGEMRRADMKGKEKQWDPEQGMVQMDGAGGMDLDEGRYPPLNETQEEERRIQENLARFAARDMARRRAARVSRQLPISPKLASPPSSSTTSSFMQRPFSVLGSISSGTSDGRRSSSIMGLMDGIMPKGKGEHPWPDGELPLTTSPRNSHNPDPYTNPYDTQPSFSPVPKMVISPTSPHHASPFADPSPEDKHNLRRASLASAGSGSSLSPLRSPVEGNGFSYGYVGPSWRGGGAAQQGHAQPEAGEKWWHALCSWGSDLDGDGENEPGGQAGRTNPFE